MPKSASFNPEVDLYIAKAAPFAQPILERVRTLIHKASPDVEETIKWGFPFFLHRGTILCHVGAFKAHCNFGLWGAEMGRQLQSDGLAKKGSILDHIATLKDLPPDKQLLAYLRQGIALIQSGRGENRIVAARRATKGTAKTPRPVPEAPPEFTAALKKSKAAIAIYATFSPSCRREYIEWSAEAKRPETRDRRITQAIEQIAEGKQHNWKYQAR